MKKLAHLAGTAIAGGLVLWGGTANAQQGPVLLPELYVTASRTGAGIVGASTSVITAEEIARSPRQTVQDVLAREPGVQAQSLFGSVNGARSVVDVRGFGATATSNTLFLINGRRITDLDLVGFDLASIPRESIERIEITRGNSGAVLYGDGAVGGVINIVTKSGAALPPKARLEGAFGSFNYREGNGSASGSSGPWSASVHGNAINSDGYRENNFYRQASGVGDFRYTVDEGSAYLNLSADSQHVGLPGGRRVDPIAGLNQLVTDRTGATTPFDYGDKQGVNATLGFTRMLAPGAELIVDGGVRHKKERAEFFFATPTLATHDPLSAVDTQLTTWSLTPRVRVDTAFGGMPWKAIGGIDYYRAGYDSDRPLFLGAAPIHRYDLNQTTLAAYGQQTLTVLPSTDLAAGARVQRTSVHARDMFNPNAPGGSFCDPFFGCFPNGVQGLPLDRNEINTAYHFGFEHRFNPYVAVFGRTAKSFRVPNVDERVGMATPGGPDPTTFNLRTQKSTDWEGGVRLNAGPLALQWSAYDMRLTDEIMFRYQPNFISSNINLDPTRRYGHETIASLRVNDSLRFKAGLTYTRAVFREGPDAGNDVPLVSRWTGSAGLSWDIWQRYLSFDGQVRYVGERRMDNDQHNLQPLIPAHTLVDVRIGGEVDRLFWSLAIQNLFNVGYFDYAIASPYPEGFLSRLNTYNAYPQPGRTFLLRAGLTFGS
jgi:iron complex outermembrane receptor protein